MEEKATAHCFVSSHDYNPCCSLAVTFCGFISHLIGCKTINIPEIFSSVHRFTRKTVMENFFSNCSPGYT